MSATTMSFLIIDTLQFSKRMQKAGLTQAVADELAEAIKETQTQSLDGLATKQDLKVLEQKFDGLEIKIENLENKIIIKMFLMMTVAVGLITWLDKVIN